MKPVSKVETGFFVDDPVWNQFSISSSRYPAANKT